jgi:hypothetical protein
MRRRVLPQRSKSLCEPCMLLFQSIEQLPNGN